MYYIKFVSEDGVETNVACYNYTVQPRNGWSFISALTRDNSNQFETTYCVGADTDWCSMFVMNINGQTIDKIVSR